jgi:hypothetical protein
MAHGCGGFLTQQPPGLLPRGPAQLVEHFSAVCDARFANELHDRRGELAGACPERERKRWCLRPALTVHVCDARAALRTRDRLATAVRMRLELVQPYIASWPQALGLQVRATWAALQSLRCVSFSLRLAVFLPATNRACRRTRSTLPRRSGSVPRL